MSIVTPEWVRDAVFYQIFPDRFAASARVHKPGPLEPWETPPTTTGFKGGDLLGVVEHLDHLAALGVTAIYLNPVFQSASNHRYHTYDYMVVDPLLGGDAALRELLDACPRARHPGHPRRRLQPRQPRLLALQPRDGGGRDSPYRDWFYFDEEALKAGRQVRAFRDDREDVLDLAEAPWDRLEGVDSLRQFGYRAWWDLPALPEAEHRQPGGPRVPLRRRRALDPLRHRRLAPRRAGGDQGRRASGASSGAGDGAEPRGVHRRRDLGGAPGGGPGRPVRRPDELPALAEAILSFVAADHHDDAVIALRTSRFAPLSAVTTRRRSRGGWSTSSRVYDPGGRRGPAQPARQPRHAAVPHDVAAATSPRSGWRR